MSFDGVGHKGEDVATLLAAGFDHCQHRLDEAAVARTLRPKRQLSPNHRVTQRPLARIVRRLNPVVPQKRPQPVAMLIQLPAHPSHLSIAALSTAQQQTLHLTADRAHATHERRLRDSAGAIIGPMLEQRARRPPQALLLYATAIQTG